jgi:thioredoxin reductase
MPKADQKTYEVIIVGGGPVGTALFQKLVYEKIYNSSDILIFDKKSTKSCFKLKNYGEFVENQNSVCSNSWKFIFDYKYHGKDIYNYFNRKYKVTIRKNEVFSIKKIDNLYTIITKKGVFFVKRVILCTGVLRKELPASVFDKNKDNYLITDRRFNDFKGINFLKQEIIFLGSGDNALMKATRLADWIVKNNIKHESACIKIFIKKSFKKNANKLFVNKLFNFNDIIKVYKNHDNIIKIRSNKNKLIRNIKFIDKEYVSTFKDGAYISVFIGDKEDLPIFDKSDKNIILAGDVFTFLKTKKPCTIYNALDTIENI